jgi:hypothetical protein
MKQGKEIMKMKSENHDHFLLLLDKLYLIEREPESVKNKNV